MNHDRFAYNRGAVQPLECMREGWQLIKDDYWLFLGISFVGLLIGQMVPFGIMLGPMMCGIYICLFRQQSGRGAKFEHLFDGFHYFAQSLIATMIVVVPMVVIFFVLYFALIVGMVALMGGGQQQGGVFAAMFGLFFLVVMSLSLIVGMLIFFMYPLIVDRELTGIEAITLSAKAVFGNLGGVLGVMLLEMGLSLLGVLCCYIGAFFVVPICMATVAVAYRRVFPEQDRLEALRPEPEPWDDDEDLPAETRLQTEAKPRRRTD